MVNEVKLLQSENELQRIRLRQLENSLLMVCKDMNQRINVLENRVDELLNELKVVTIKHSTNVEHDVFDNNYTHGNWRDNE